MTAPTSLHHIEVTVAHHGDDEFYMLGRVMPESGGAVLTWNAAPVQDVAHEVPPTALYAALPDEPCERVDGRSTCPEFCVILDACEEDGDIVGNKEVSLEVADLLLDGQFSERLATARNELDAYYAYEATRPPGVSAMDWLMRRAAERGAA